MGLIEIQIPETRSIETLFGHCLIDDRLRVQKGINCDDFECSHVLILVLKMHKKPIMEELNLSEMTISIRPIVVTLLG